MKTKGKKKNTVTLLQPCKTGKTSTPAPVLASVPGIVDPMLKTGKYTRAQIMDEVRRLRPDFKDPSAAVSNGLIRLRQSNAAGGLVEVPKERKPKAANTGTRRRAGVVAGARRNIADSLQKIDDWAARMTDEISAGFRRRDEYLAEMALQPRHHRVWA